MTQTLEELVAVKGRFYRSISLVADWGTPEAMTEYLATGTVVELASGILEELDNEIAARAWSITGPYGSGKSAFALFLCEVLAKAHPSHRAAHALRRRHQLGSRRFLPVLASAERGPLAPVLLRALANASGRSGHRGSKVLPDGARVVKVLEETATRARQRRYSGLVVVVDELGKFLEYAALHPQDADVFLLQQVAEAATRSAIPIMLVTILHSGFADYLPATEEVRRSEWQKVQGRFRDIPFQLPAHQVLQLVGSAIDARLPDTLAKVWRGELDSFLASRVLPVAGANWAGVLQKCFPLHPLTAILLWPLFRSKGAQNERSLFSFLTSREPHGLREYLAATGVAAPETPLYRPSHLFDYISTSLGLGAFRGDHARRWALADQALARLPADAPAASGDVIKSIALLSLYGAQVGVTASPALVALSVGSRQDAEDACEYLSKASLVVYRSHSDSFALWEGSDFELESAHERALQRLRGSASLAQRLQRVLQVRPFVPRAHYVRTGTLRWFDVGLVSSDEDLAAFLRGARDCDGVVAFVVPDGDTIERAPEAELLEALVAEAGKPVILALPKDVAGIELALNDLEAWTWVATYSLELAGDPVARQEVRSRVTAARDRLESLVGAVLGLPGFVMEPSRCQWRYDGSSVRPATGRAFQEWLSGICDAVYARAPKLRNELLNRSVLSSAAAKARRTLIERMLGSSVVERLGIEGWPPEAAMYEAMLRAPGMHRQDGSTWTFGRPKGDWAPAWAATVEFARSSSNARRTVSELFHKLRMAPYGLKDGPLPVLLCAVMCSLGDEIALYEDGVFLPELAHRGFRAVAAPAREL